MYNYYKRHPLLKWSSRIGVVIIFAILIVYTVKIYIKRPLCFHCNVILISLDTLSALHLPCYGYERNTAPNLCEYGKENLFFFNSYSHAPITLDSHFSIFTSLYPHTHKMIKVYKGILDEKYLTLANILQMNGYKTVYNGPLTDPHLPLSRGIERGFDIIEKRYSPTTTIQDWANSLIRLKQNDGKNKSTFLFLHTYAVHDPYLTGHKTKHLFTDHAEYPHIPLTSKEYIALSPEFYKFTADFILGKYYFASSSNTFKSDAQIARKIEDSKSDTDTLAIGKTLSPTATYTSLQAWYEYKVDRNDPNQVAYVKALYDERIYDLDESLKSLFEFLNKSGLSRDTIVVITADHGEEFMEHKEMYHANNLYATSTRVPLIIHIPGVGPKEIKDMVQGIDIYPTLLGLTGLLPKSPLEGIDLSELIKGEKGAVKNSFLLSEFRGRSAIQKDNYRFYYNSNHEPIELYDLNKDPQEQNNLLKSNPEYARQLLSIMERY